MFNKKRKLDTIKSEHLFYFILFLFILLLSIFYTLKSSLQNLSKKIPTSNYVENFLSKNIFNNKKNEIIENNFIKNTENTFNRKYFENINIEAKAYVVYDVNNDEIIHSKNENEILPLASLTKVASAITMMHIASGTEKITIKKNLLNKGEYLDIGLIEGQEWEMQELLKFALVYSSNAAMDIIAKTINNKNSTEDFIKEMNDYIKKVGYKNFTFNSVSGLDYIDLIGGSGNAIEYAKLFADSYQLTPEILTYTTNSKINVQSSENKIYNVSNTNRSASAVVGLLASKTGYTDAAGGNLAILVDIGLNRRVVIVVLGSTINGRFIDVDTLYNATLKSLVNN
jgi:hypothetical protein